MTIATKSFRTQTLSSTKTTPTSFSIAMLSKLGGFSAPLILSSSFFDGDYNYKGDFFWRIGFSQVFVLNAAVPKGVAELGQACHESLSGQSKEMPETSWKVLWRCCQVPIYVKTLL